MPYLSEEDLTSLHGKIDEAQKELEETNTSLEETQENLKTKDESLQKVKKNAKIQNIILSILAGIALALAFFFYNKKGSSSSIDITEIQKLEAERVIDSIQNSPSFTAINSTSDSNSTSVEDIKNTLTGKKVFSVQIGAFSDRNYALLSESIAGIGTNNGDLFKYSVGLFDNLQEAQDFRRELVKIGFRDAFVASYIDGVRQEIEHPNR